MGTPHLRHRDPLLMGLKAWAKKRDFAEFVVTGQIRHVRVAKFTSTKDFAIETTTCRNLHA
jgi:hypothetical protein